MILRHSVLVFSLPNFKCFERIFLVKLSLPSHFPQCQVQLNSLLPRIYSGSGLKKENQKLIGLNLKLPTLPLWRLNQCAHVFQNEAEHISPQNVTMPAHPFEHPTFQSQFVPSSISQ